MMVCTALSSFQAFTLFKEFKGIVIFRHKFVRNKEENSGLFTKLIIINSENL